MSETITHEDAIQVDESIRRARQIMDDRLRGLTLASRFWKISLVAIREERISLAVELDHYGLFSLSQLGKITRTHKATLAKALGAKKRPGGRFEPEALGALVSLRKKAIADEPLSLELIEDLVKTGNSVGCICNLVGVPDSVYYNRVAGKKVAA